MKKSSVILATAMIAATIISTTSISPLRVKAASSDKVSEIGSYLNYSQQYSALPEIANGSWGDMKIQIDDMIFREDGTETLPDALASVVLSANASAYTIVDYNPNELIDNTSNEVHDYVIQKNGNDYFTIRCRRALYSPSALKRQAINASELYVVCVVPKAEAKHNTFFSGGVRFDFDGITYDNFWTMLNSWGNKCSYSYSSGLSGTITFYSNHATPQSYVLTNGQAIIDSSKKYKGEEINISFDPITRQCYLESRSLFSSSVRQ